MPFLTSTITSPPYANLVDYGTENQIGFGQSYDHYLDECAAIFSDIHRWTLDDGSLWLIADTLIDPAPGSGPRSLVPLPFGLAERAEQHGWILRDVIIWRKDRTRPWSSGNRMRNAFEYVLYFTRGPHAKFRVERVRDISGLGKWWVKYPERYNPWGMSPDNVWEYPIPVQGSWASTTVRHACPLPDGLVRRMIQLSTDEGDVVFDPFAGIGVVPAVAEAEARVPLGIELNPEFVDAYRAHTRPNTLSSKATELDVDAVEMTAALLTLRVLKYPKELMRQLVRAGTPRSALRGAYVTAGSLDTTPGRPVLADISCSIFVDPNLGEDDVAEIQKRAIRACTKPPLSKYGVAATISISKVDTIDSIFESNDDVYAYVNGHTWWASSAPIGAVETTALLEEENLKSHPPVLSPLFVQQLPED